MISHLPYCLRSYFSSCIIVFRFSSTSIQSTLYSIYISFILQPFYLFPFHSQLSFHIQYNIRGRSWKVLTHRKQLCLDEVTAIKVYIAYLIHSCLQVLGIWITREKISLVAAYRLSVMYIIHLWLRTPPPFITQVTLYSQKYFPLRWAVCRCPLT